MTHAVHTLLASYALFIFFMKGLRFSRKRYINISKYINSEGNYETTFSQTFR
jgi:hypothetical protein